MLNRKIEKKSAGNFSSWLKQIRQAQISNISMEVSCGDCRACCTSSYFIHIKPCEFKTLSKIPQKILFNAPGLAKGNVLLGYDEKGHCPMLIDNECSIYEYRPQTCRDYDCRIFPATGLSEDANKPLITAQLNRWQFDFSTEQDYQYISAVKSAAKFLIEHKEIFPKGFVPTNPTQQVVLAIKVYDVFLKKLKDLVESNHENHNKKIMKAVLEVYKKFENNNNG